MGWDGMGHGTWNKAGHLRRFGIYMEKFFGTTTKCSSLKGLRTTSALFSHRSVQTVNWGHYPCETSLPRMSFQILKDECVGLRYSFWSWNNPKQVIEILLFCGCPTLAAVRLMNVSTCTCVVALEVRAERPNTKFLHVLLWHGYVWAARTLRIWVLGELFRTLGGRWDGLQIYTCQHEKTVIQICMKLSLD